MATEAVIDTFSTVLLSYKKGQNWVTSRDTDEPRECHTVASWSQREKQILHVPGSSNGKESACDAGNQVSTPGLRSSSGERNGNPLQYSRLENPVDRGARWAAVREVAKGQILSN